VSTRRVAIVGAVIALATTAVGSTAQATRVEGPFGSGAAQVWIILPKGRTRSVVVFGHGWKLAPPVPPLVWINQFRPWLDHLASRGNAIVFPRYQFGANDSLGTPRVLAYRRGLITAFARLGRPHVPVVANVTADYERTADEVRRNLVSQLASPVRWLESVRRLISDGHDTFVEVGPAKVLTGLMKGIDPEVRAFQTNDPAGISKVLEAVTAG